MPRYNYTDLDTTANDIRLITLLPGEFDADIEIHIHHGPLISMPSEHQDTRMSLKELTDTLPTGWNVFETLGGKYIFENDETEDTSWTHPDPEFARIYYDVDLDSMRPQYSLDYEALSYTWGDPNPAEVAFVLPRDGYGERLIGIPIILNIGSNLARALRHFRNPNSSRVLWIDAICINQSNITERNEQVLRMKDIYKYASRVLVWLGEDSQDSKIALETIKLFAEQVEYSTNNALLRFPEAKYPDWFKIKKAVPFTHAQWRAIDRLLCRSWFDRVWTMQEIAVGSIQSIIQCGHTTLGWDLFRKAVRCLNAKKVLHEISNNRLQLVALSTLMGSKFTAMRTVIRAASHRKATDPRDKVYGILGILPPKFAGLIKPDYALPLQLVYRNFALAYLDHFRRLDLIVERPRVSESWVMNWFHSASITNTAGHLFASGLSSSQVQLIQPDMIEVTGVIKATIQSIEAPLIADKFEALKAIQSSPEWQGCQESQYLDGDPMEDALVSLWCLNYLKETFVVSKMGFPTLEAARQLLSPFQLDNSSISPKGDVDFYLSRIISRVTGLCLFTTIEGYIGLCPSWAKPGDIICVLLGCRALAILRSLPSKPKPFYLVGDCYVHGLSFAEGLVGPVKAPWRPRIGRGLRGINYPWFENMQTGEVSPLDPRLGALPSEWRELPDSDWTPDDPNQAVKFRNVVTGAEINSDPRLLPEALESRGVRIKKLLLG